MQLIEHLESYMIRRNTHMRSLFVEYARPEQTSVIASLFDRGHLVTRFNLPVVTATSTGIELRLPASVSGLFELQIRDGKQQISKWLAIQ